MAFKGHIPWNKGKKHSDETIEKIKKSLVGKNIKENHWNWKGGISEIGYCLDCGIKLKSYPSKYCHTCSYKHRVSPSQAKENHYRWRGGPPKCLKCGKEIAYKAKYCSSCSKLGERNNNWHGGASFDDYPIDFNNILKWKIKKRDGYKCSICGFIPNKESKKRLVIHHIDYNKENLNAENFITLCGTCHTKTNYKREGWVAFFGKDIKTA